MKTFLVSIFLSGALLGQSASPKDAGVKPVTVSASTTAISHRNSPYVPHVTNRARDYYQLIWGVDSMAAKFSESGEMIRFTYRVIDPAKAASLSDKKLTPYLIDRSANVRLEIPTLEKVGQLRQAADPESGKTYWMVFSNKGRPVKPGHRVSVVIGNFHADELLVQ